MTKYTVSWYETALVADKILMENIKNDGIKIIFNNFKSVIAYEAKVLTVPSAVLIKNARKFFQLYFSKTLCIRN